MKHIYLFLILLYTSPAVLGQEKHLILFKDKDTSADPSTFLSSKSLERRTKQGISITDHDHPVTTAYLDSLASTGATVVYPTKWLNGALVEGTSEQIQAIKAFTFLRESTNFNDLYGGTKINEVKEVNTFNYGPSAVQLEMLGVDEMHELGYTGKGITIAVFDSGFPGVNTTDPFDSLRTKNGIKGTFDFVVGDENVYNDHHHGTNVLSTIAAYKDGELIGAAFDADFYLFKTEDVFSETPVEEFNWLVAAERADSIGVDIITSSLGYYDFDIPSYNYSHSDLNGDKSIISQAADFAAATGILVVTSAGNSGADAWGKIAMPADGDSVLSVGAVNANGIIANFSSRGPTADGRVKPDIMAMGVGTVISSSSGNIQTSNGTSFSCPLITGFAACVWQQFPGLTNMELIELLRNSGDISATPNSDYGYGIPNYQRLSGLTPLDPNHNGSFTKGIKVYPNPFTNGTLKLHFDQELLGKSCQLYVYTATGKLIHEERLEVTQLTHPISMTTEKKQLYLIKIAYEEQQEVIRVLSE